MADFSMPWGFGFPWAVPEVVLEGIAHDLEPITWAGPQQGQRFILLAIDMAVTSNADPFDFWAYKTDPQQQFWSARANSGQDVWQPWRGFLVFNQGDSLYLATSEPLGVWGTASGIFVPADVAPFGS